MAKLKKPTVKNPQLVEALAELKEHSTQGAVKNLMEALKGAQLIAPVIIDNMPEDLDLSDGKQFQTNAKFTMLQQKDGSRYFPAFTDWLEVLKWRNDPEINTVVMTVEQYANLMQRSGEASGIVINPSEQGYLIDRPHLAQLTGLTLPPAASEYRNEPLPEPTLNPMVAFADASTLSNPQLVGAIAAFRMMSTQETELPMIDALFRSQVIAPVQLINAEQDLNMEDGEKHQPVMLHRALFGSIERFLGILIEHHASKLPLWLSPEQVEKCPIVSDIDDYAEEVVKKLQEAGLYAKSDLRNEKINYKVREHSLAKVPVIAVVGAKEKENGTVTVRRLGSEKQETVKLDDFVAALVKEAQMPHLHE